MVRSEMLLASAAAASVSIVEPHNGKWERNQNIPIVTDRGGGCLALS